MLTDLDTPPPPGRDLTPLLVAVLLTVLAAVMLFAGSGCGPSKPNPGQFGTG